RIFLNSNVVLRTLWALCHRKKDGNRGRHGFQRLLFLFKARQALRACTDVGQEKTNGCKAAEKDRLCRRNDAHPRLCRADQGSADEDGPDSRAARHENEREGATAEKIRVRRAKARRALGKKAGAIPR